MTGLLDGRVAVITGAGSERGIGRATAELFAAHGAACALVDVDGAAAERHAEALGAPHRGYPCDVRDKAAVERTIAAARKDFGRIDVLVNNAGLVSGTAFTDIDQAEYDAILDTNLRGNFLMAQAVVPAMRQAGGGAIVCIASIAGQNGGGVFGRSHYAAAKAGIMGLAKALGRELAPGNIRCNAIAAGTVDNEFTKGAMTPEYKAKIAAQVPLGRLGRPEDIANACLYLASDMSDYVTGTVLDVNGGLLIH